MRYTYLMALNILLTLLSTSRWDIIGCYITHWSQYNYILWQNYWKPLLSNWAVVVVSLYSHMYVITYMIIITVVCSIKMAVDSSLWGSPLCLQVMQLQAIDNVANGMHCSLLRSWLHIFYIGVYVASQISSVCHWTLLHLCLIHIPYKAPN